MFKNYLSWMRLYIYLHWIKFKIFVLIFQGHVYFIITYPLVTFIVMQWLTADYKIYYPLWTLLGYVVVAKSDDFKDAYTARNLLFLKMPFWPVVICKRLYIRIKKKKGACQ